MTTSEASKTKTVARRTTWKRKVAVASAGLFALLAIAAGVLWFLKPWVPDIELTAPGPTGRRVIESGLFANYFPAVGVTRGPAVVVLGGSEGGIGPNSTRAALELQANGFSVLTPAYFGAPGQPESLERVPLETFDRALAWLRSRREVDPDRIAVVGQSKGAEATLLVAIRHPELEAVVASAPSSAVRPGISWTSLHAEPSWTSSGRPLEVLPYGGHPLLSNVGRLYSEGLKQLRRYPQAAIEVERIKAAVLLVCGEGDTLWPSCRMARQLKARAARAGVPPVRILAYKVAGHRVFGPAVRAGTADFDRLRRWGGTPAANNAARVDGWPKVIEFLRAKLAVSAPSHTR